MMDGDLIITFDPAASFEGLHATLGSVPGMRALCLKEDQVLAALERRCGRIPLPVPGRWRCGPEEGDSHFWLRAERNRQGHVVALTGCLAPRPRPRVRRLFHLVMDRCAVRHGGILQDPSLTA